MARLALKLGYNGRSFYGYQRQPHVRTVEGDIIRACIKMRAFDSPDEAEFSSASRTDRGVHAIGNAVAFNTAFQPEELLDGLNATCRDIVFHSYLEVNSSFNPRRARMRHYRYLLYDDVGTDALDSALRQFVGSRDFKHFSKSDARGRYRSIDRIEVTEGSECKLVDFYGKSFLHNMIRRIMAAAVSVARGDATERDIEIAFEGRPERNFGLAPPEFLILMDVDYGMDFRKVAVRQETVSRWRQQFDSTRALETVEGLLMKSMGGIA